MILVRDVFRLKFGKARDAKAVWKEGAEFQRKLGFNPRGMVDLTGSYYTLVMETTFDSLAAYEKALKDIMATPAFGAWYQKFMPFVESGNREIFTLLD